MKLSARRKYKSQVREAHSAQTCELILSSVSELLAKKGPQGLTYRSVARHSGVSLSTLFRYFPSKSSLLKGVSDWAETKVEDPVVTHPNPQSPEELISRMLARFQHHDAHPEIARAYLLSRNGRFLRKKVASVRVDMVARALRGHLSGLDPAIKQDIIAMCYFLISTSAWEHFKYVWGFDAATSSKLCGRTVRLLLDAARHGKWPIADFATENR